MEAIAAKLGPHPDVLCNNAGGGEANWFESGRQEEWHSVDIWRRYVELNLNSVYLVSREVVPRMKVGRGDLQYVVNRRLTRNAVARCLCRRQSRRYFLHQDACPAARAQGHPRQCGRARPYLYENLGRAGRRDWAAVRIARGWPSITPCRRSCRWAASKPPRTSAAPSPGYALITRRTSPDRLSRLTEASFSAVRPCASLEGQRETGTANAL